MLLHSCPAEFARQTLQFGLLRQRLGKVVYTCLADVQNPSMMA